MLTQVFDEDHPCPHGFCEVWSAVYDSPRRVEIVSEEYAYQIPGLRHVVSYLTGNKHEVIGYFYVPNGYTLANAIAA